MNIELTNDTLLRLSEHLARNMGINFSVERLSDLKTKMSALAEAFEFQDLTQFSEWLISDRLSREQIELLADFLTVGETYFFRDPKAFSVLEYEILPPLIQSRQDSRFLRIWCAACCTGEEPYSVAMILKKLIPDIGSWRIKILATDINQTFLRRASEGLYGEWSFRATADHIKQQYFIPKRNNKFQIDSEIRKMVQFEWMNLAETGSFSDPTFAGMDIIFCRNVLIYFDAEHARRIVSSMNNCLLPDGYLFVGPNELPVANDPSFQSLHRAGAIVLQKTTAQLPEDFAQPLFLFTDMPENANASENLPTLEEAQDSYNVGNYEEAAALLSQRCDNGGGDFSSLILLAKSLANQGELKNALKWCDRAIKANRLNATAHYLRATILQEQDATNECMHSLRQALLMDANFIVAHLNLGILLKQMGEHKDATKHFKSVLKLLDKLGENEIVPESEGTTASGMKVIVSSLMKEQTRHE